jgi:hypothetical protein
MADAVKADPVSSWSSVMISSNSDSACSFKLGGSGRRGVELPFKLG